MFWKIALVSGVVGLIFGILIFVFSFSTLNSTKDENTETIAVVGIVIGIVLLLFSLLLIAVSVIFVLRASKKQFDAKNPK